MRNSNTHQLSTKNKNYLKMFKTPTFGVPLTSAIVQIINLFDFNLDLKNFKKWAASLFY